MTTFIFCGFILFAALSLCISWLSLSHSRLHNKAGLSMLIGIRTPNTMASKQAWAAAHKAAAPFFAVVAVYFGSYGIAVMMIPSLQPSEEPSGITIIALLVGVVLFLGATAIGDRAAKSFVPHTEEAPAPQIMVVPQPLVTAAKPQKTTLMHRSLNPVDYD